MRRAWKLGDQVEAALTTIGITKERVERWLGKKCGCKERKEKLNRLSAWAQRVLTGQTEDAEKHFENMTEIVDPGPEEKKLPPQSRQL